MPFGSVGGTWRALATKEVPVKEELNQSPVTDSAKPPVEGDPNTLAAEIASLGSMTISHLHRKYLEVYGFPTKNRNAATVRKRIAYRLTGQSGSSDLRRVCCVSFSGGM
jgi:hypothetical protein